MTTVAAGGAGRRRRGRAGAAARRPLAALAVVAAALGLGGCRPDTVRLSFRPAPGERSTYRIEVRAVAVTTLDGQAPRRTEATTVLEARHAVLGSGPEGSRVEVRVAEEGEAAATFVVRLDRGAQLAEVQQVEGLPADVLGDLGLSEIFPAAAAAPPDRPLGPGSRWDIDGPVLVGGSPPARLTGSGRLVELGTVEGRDVARVETSYRLPVRRTAEQTDGRLRLEGTQDTSARVAYDLDGGGVHAVRATTEGRYHITLLPPPGVQGVPVPGALVVEVRSTTRRVG